MLGAEEFIAFYPEVRKIISDYLHEIAVDWVHDHCIEMIDYSTRGGKFLRGIVASSVYLELTGYKPDSEEAKVGYIIGWTLELIQAANLMADDLMDQSETRRGQMCWYKKEKVGDQCVNDALIVENLGFVLLDTLRWKLPIKVYAELLKEARKVNTITTMGQTLDFIAKEKSFKAYDLIVTHKTSYYSLAEPVLLGLIASQKFALNENFEQIVNFTLKLGYYFQAQDDYIDVYGDPAITGKVGTDIKEGKITWLLCKAYELANEDQKKQLDQKIGKDEFVDDIKKLYNDLNICKAYKEFTEAEEKQLYAIIDGLDPKFPVKTLRAFTNKLSNRNH